MSGIVFQMSEEAIATIAEKAAAIVLRKQAAASPWLTTKEAAEYLHLPLSRIEKLSATNAIPRHKNDGRVLFHRDELDDWMLAQTEGSES